MKTMVGLEIENPENPGFSWALDATGPTNIAVLEPEVVAAQFEFVSEAAVAPPLRLDHRCKKDAWTAGQGLKCLEPVPKSKVNPDIN